MSSDPGPMARLEAVKADAEAPSEVFRRLTDGDKPETLRQIAKAWAVPKGRFVEWFTTDHSELYDAALKVKAADCADAAAQAALDATPETVAVEKLRADVAFKLASRWDRDRYGERAAAGSAAVPLADAVLLVRCGQLLDKASKGQLRLEREVRTDALPSLPSQPVTLRPEKTI